MDMQEMFQRSRYDAGLSQQKVADLMKVSKSTVQNWENGTSVPTFDKIIEWFKVLGVPMYPYLMKLAYPKELADVSADSDIAELRKGLNKLVDELDDFHAKELFFLLSGTHGSSPTGNMDLSAAYLHLPLANRVIIAENILANYEMMEALGQIHNTQHVLPATQTLKRSIDTARTAAMAGKNSYIEE
ncbi:MAG: helix-turn-helix transcriptional regulator [Prevotellaceae bacterium]|nr:helix-turn-helix transcriptional regulator [Candidatus Colivivens equi]